MKQEEENIKTSQSSNSEETSPKKKKSEKKVSDSKKKEKKEKNNKKEKKEKKKESTEKNNSAETLSTDSILVNSNDSIFANDSLSIDSSLNTIDTIAKKDTTTIAPASYLSGNKPVTRINHPGHDSGIMILITVTFLLISYNFNHFRRLLYIYWQDLWNVRRRANAFNAHTTNERNVIVILIFQLCVYAGILISAKINTLIPINPEKIMITTCSMMGIYALYYIFQLSIYSLVGYVFTDNINSAQCPRTPHPPRSSAPSPQRGRLL